jgi:hypothetical protein
LRTARPLASLPHLPAGRLMDEFPWESLPEQGEHYIALDPIVLEAIRELSWLSQIDRRNLPTIRLVLRVVRIDEVGGDLVLGLRFVRDLDPPAS